MALQSGRVVLGRRSLACSDDCFVLVGDIWSSFLVLAPVCSSAIRTAVSYGNQIWQLEAMHLVKRRVVCVEGVGLQFLRHGDVRSSSFSRSHGSRKEMRRHAHPPVCTRSSTLCHALQVVPFDPPLGGPLVDIPNNRSNFPLSLRISFKWTSTR